MPDTSAAQSLRCASTARTSLAGSLSLVSLALARRAQSERRGRAEDWADVFDITKVAAHASLGAAAAPTRQTSSDAPRATTLRLVDRATADVRVFAWPPGPGGVLVEKTSADGDATWADAGDAGKSDAGDGGKLDGGDGGKSDAGKPDAGDGGKPDAWAPDAMPLDPAAP